MTSPAAPSSRLLYGVGLVCFANLLLEVVLTRIFSTTMFYHFIFLSIALALFGMGTSGVYVYLRADRFPIERVAEDLAQNARRFAVSTVLTLMYVLANPISVIQGKLDPGTAGPEFSGQIFLQLLLFSAATAVPFFFAGMVVSLAVTHYSRHIDRVYFYDLVGAALAALLAGVLLGLFGGPSLVIGIAVLALGAAALFKTPSRAGWVGAALMLALLVWNLRSPLLDVPSVKGVVSGRVVFEKWNTFSRVTVEKMNPTTWDIRIDASAATNITNARTIPTRKWQVDISSLAHHMFAAGAEHTLIIGPGGGPDVANALAANSKHVTGVEVNPLISEDIMSQKFTKESGGLYADPRVTIVTDEGRSFIRRSDVRYDIIQATLVDTWAATAAGAFSLTENTLYTIEAFDDYLSHLTDAGAVTMTRWYNSADPESLRLVLLAAGALEKRGIPPGETRKHLFFARRGGRGTLVAKRTPISPDELARLSAACPAPCEIILSPATPGTHEFEKLVDAGAWSAAVLAKPLDLTPPTDDRPFFFYFLKPGEIWHIGDHFGDKVKVANPAVWILLAFGFTLAGLTVAFIVLPLLYHRAGLLLAGGPGGPKRRILALGYFGAIGLAFITVEIALLQRFGFFLGHPSYALLVVLFSILVTTAIGARLSGKVPARLCPQLVLGAGLSLTALTIVFAVVISPALQGWVAWPATARILLAGVLTGICGLLMGIMLPTGVRLVAEHDAEIVPWGWGINGATSVIGTVAATVIAIHHGFTTTLIGGGLLYAVAGFAGLVLARFVAQARGA